MEFYSYIGNILKIDLEIRKLYKGEGINTSFLKPSPHFICYLWKESSKNTNSFHSWYIVMRDKHDLILQEFRL